MPHNIKSTAENFSQEEIYDFEKHTLAAYQHKLRINAIANETLISINKWHKTIQHQSKISIIEIGCGEGRLLKYISDFLKLNYHGTSLLYYSGIDPSESRISIARKIFPECTFQVESVETFVSKESYDIVVCSEVIEHVHDPLILLKNIKNLMNNNGMLVITTPNILTLDNYFKKVLGFKVKPTTSSHIREYTYNAFLDLLSNYFIIVKYYSIGFRLPLYWKLKKIQNLSFVYKNIFELSYLFPQYGRILLAIAYKKKI